MTRTLLAGVAVAALKRMTTLLLAMSLMGGMAALAHADPAPDASDQPQCGHEGQPACDPKGEPAADQKDRAKCGHEGQPACGKGKSRSNETGQPANGQQGHGGQQGQQGQTDQTTTQDQSTPAQPADAKRRGKPAGEQGPAQTGQQGQGGQQDQTGQHDQTNTNGQSGAPTPPADARRRGDKPAGDQAPAGQQGQPAGTQYGQPSGRELPAGQRWSRGERLPDQYRRDQYAVTDWRRHNLPPPQSGYRWLCFDRGNCFLIDNRTGTIRRALWRDDRNDYWRRRYTRIYTYNDDLYYRECRNRPDPAGILVGGLIGGLIGHSIGDDRAGDTFAGIIIGGAIGAALTNDLDCDDRSYAYRVYYDGLNSGRTGTYRWRNPHNRHRGEFRVRRYFYDDDGFVCANYSHIVYLDRMRRVNGLACRQPDGVWLFVN